MVRILSSRLILSTSLMICLSTIVSAQTLSSSVTNACPTVGGCFTRCDHVIEMIRRHGVNNTFNRLGSQSLLSPWATMPDTMMPGTIHDTELGDLQIIAVTLHPQQDASCGPRFCVVVRNESVRKICGVQLSAVAVFGQIRPTSPNATITIESIGPGESIEASIQLPLDAYAMGNRNGVIMGYQQLIVAIDSFDEFLEIDEANNIRSFAVDQLVAVTPASEATTVIESSNETIASPVAALPANPSAVAPVSPVTTQVGEVSAEGLSTDPTNVDSLRQAIDRLALPAESQSSAVATP